MKCSVCENYLRGIDTCKFCSFEWATSYNPCLDEEWDILNIDEEEEWRFKQIQDRLKYKGIDCLIVLDWFGDNIILLFGCNDHNARIARALDVHEECIVNDLEYGVVGINLYKEKMIRNREVLKDDEEM
ncbi:hypothetical protein [Methanobrevibacter sp.]